MQDIRALSLPQIEALFTEWGEPRFRAKQLYEWLWAKGATNWDALTNLPKALRTKLAEQYTFNTCHASKKKSKKVQQESSSSHVPSQCLQQQ